MWFAIFECHRNLIKVSLHCTVINKIMRCNILLYAIFAVRGKWTLANEIPDDANLLNRILQDTELDGDEDTFAHVCDDTDESLSDKVQVTRVEAENVSFFGSIINRFNGSFDGTTRFGRLMNGVFAFFQRRQSTRPRYKISTDLFIPALSKYSATAKSLITLIKSESESYAAVSDTPEVVRALFDFSAENMESVTSIIDSILDDLSQHDTMDLATVSCLMGRLSRHLLDDSFSKVVSMAEFVYTKSGNDDMEEMFNNYIATRIATSDSVTEDNAQEDSAFDQCPNQGYSNTFSESSIMESQNYVQARNIGGGDYFAGSYLASVGLSLVAIVGLIILFPLSFIVSLATLVFAIFSIIISVIFKKPLFPEDPNCTEFCGLENIGYIIAVFGLIASPILVPIAIVISIVVFFGVLISPIFLTDQPTDPPNEQPAPSPPVFVPLPASAPAPVPIFGFPPGPVVISAPSTQSQINLNKQTRDVTHLLSELLETPLSSIFDTLKGLYSSDKTEDAEMKLDRDLKSTLCQNDELMAALSF